MLRKACEPGSDSESPTKSPCSPTPPPTTEAPESSPSENTHVSRANQKRKSCSTTTPSTNEAPGSSTSEKTGVSQANKKKKTTVAPAKGKLNKKVPTFLLLDLYLYIYY